MNPYLSGIMALSQLTPEQFDTGMQRFQQIQGMQPQGLSALQARQSGLTGSMAGMGQAIPQGPFYAGNAPQQTMSGEYVPPRRAPQNFDEKPPSIKEAVDSGLLTVDVFPTQRTASNQSFAMPFGGSSTGVPLDHPTTSPFSSTRGSFGTGAMPYTQPYYQRSFNPYAGGYGMGFGGGMPSYGGFGGGQQMYGGFGGGKGGGRPSYGGGKGGRGY